jgi:hypothetical protein
MSDIEAGQDEGGKPKIGEKAGLCSEAVAGRGVFASVEQEAGSRD